VVFGVQTVRSFDTCPEGGPGFLLVDRTIQRNAVARWDRWLVAIGAAAIAYGVLGSLTLLLPRFQFDLVDEANEWTSPAVSAGMGSAAYLLIAASGLGTRSLRPPVEVACLRETRLWTFGRYVIPWVGAIIAGGITKLAFG
jgi:hypothetical protein